MTIEEARASIGKMVMSRDAGHKLIRSVEQPHGPYLLRNVTKGGMAVIAREGHDYVFVPPSLLSLPDASMHEDAVTNTK